MAPKTLSPGGSSTNQGTMLVPQIGRTGRTTRRPRHSFQLRTRPWMLQPFMLAPVLPGETLTKLWWQSRVVTDPIKNPLIGWSKEYYFFYVKHRDLDERATMTALALNPDTSMAALVEAAANYPWYHAAGGINWTKKCLKRVVEEYFRDEAHAWDAGLLDTIPLAYMTDQGDSWMDSLTSDSQMPDTDPSDTSLEAYDPQWLRWQYMRGMGLIQGTYEDFLKSYGVNIMVEEPNRPELIRYVRKWQYPSNTVDPTTGVPSSAVSWSFREQANKRRFFTEPGWILGITVARPKIYLRFQDGQLAHHMDDLWSWLPGFLNTSNPEISLKKFADNTGPLTVSTDTGGYFVDMRDLYLYGDQYINFDRAATNANMADQPIATNVRRPRIMPTEAGIDEFFTNSAGGYKFIREDGVCTPYILGNQRDMT